MKVSIQQLVFGVIFSLLASVAGQDLSGQDLSGQDLSGQDLSRVRLIYADLSGANLTNIDLSGADLYKAKLANAKLVNANLKGANLTYADLAGADLKGAKLISANLKLANLQDANLANANLQAANLSGTYLQDANLTNTRLFEANLNGAEYNGNTILPEPFNPETKNMSLVDSPPSSEGSHTKPSPDWEAILTITSDDTSIASIIRTLEMTGSRTIAATSTDGFDVGVDESAPPKPMAPTQKLDAFFPVAGFVTRLQRDSKPFGDLVNWQLNLQADETGGTIEWDVSGVPINRSLTLTLPDGSVLNMKSSSSTAYGITKKRVGVDNQTGEDVFTITSSFADPNDLFPALVLVDEDSTANDIRLTVADASVEVPVFPPPWFFVEDENQMISYSITRGPINGTAIISEDVITYNPSMNFSGTDTLVFSASDGTTSTDKEITITVTQDNLDPPVADDIAITVDEDSADNVINLTGSDPDGDDISFEWVSDPAFGVIDDSRIADTPPQLLYTPKADHNESVSITYKAIDNSGLESIAVGNITVKIAAINDAPVAEDLPLPGKSVTTSEDVSLQISLVASDVEADSLDYILVTEPSQGTVELINRVASYQPETNYYGPDSFTFQVKEDTEDGLESNIATVSITVETVNDPPVAVGQNLTTDEDTAIAIILDGTDIEGSTLTYVIVGEPSKGTLSQDGTGPNLTYTPNQHANNKTLPEGADSFTFKVNDGQLDSQETATVTVNLTPQPDPPEAPSDPLVVVAVANKSKTIFLTASDPDDDSLTYVFVTKPIHGTATIDGSIVTYTSGTTTSEEIYTGPDIFTYKANDGLADSNFAKVELTIVTNPPPIVENMSWFPKPAEVDEDLQLRIFLSAIDEPHPDDETLDEIDHYRIVMLPTQGVISGVDSEGKSANGIITYSPDLNYPGIKSTDTDSFSFVANDGTSDSEPLTVTVTVNQTPDAPIAEETQVTVLEDSIENPINLTGYDPDGDHISSFQVISNPDYGTLIVTETDVKYTPEANFPHANVVKSDTFTFTVTDDTGRVSQRATVTIDVTPVNDPPVTFDFSPIKASDGIDNDGDGQIDETDEKNFVAVQRSANNPIDLSSSDPDKDSLVFIIMDPPASGLLSVSNNTAYYTPDPSFSGVDSFTFKASDGLADSNTSIANLQVDAAKTEVVDSAQLSTEGVTSEVHVEGGTIAIELPAGSNPNIEAMAIGIAVADVSSQIPAGASEAEKAIAAREMSNQLKLQYTETLSDMDSEAEEALQQKLILAQGPMIQLEITTDDGGNETDFSANPLTLTLPRTSLDVNAVALADASGTQLVETRILDEQNLEAIISHLSLIFTVSNQAPTAEDKSISLQEDSSEDVTLTGADADSDPITYVIISQPSKGVLSGTAPNLTYRSDSNLHGDDFFTYVTNDGATNSMLATVSISIAATNDSPSASSQTIDSKEDTTVNIMLLGSDVDGDTISYLIVSQPSNGSLTGSGKSQTYTPNSHFNGTDSFTFKTRDSSTTSSIATVNINVSSINDVPELSPMGNISLGEDAENHTIELTGQDADGDDLTYTVTNTNTDLVTATLENNKLTLDLQPDQNGSSSLSITVTDPNQESASQSFNLTVSPVADAPVVTATSVMTAEDQPLEITLDGIDVDEDKLTYGLVDMPGQGTLSTIIDGKDQKLQSGWLAEEYFTAGTKAILTYSPNANYHGADKFTFQASDGELSSEVATIDISITTVNDPPTANSQRGDQRVEFTTSTVDIHLSGQDIEEDVLTYIVESPPRFGQLSGEPPNLVYTPDITFTGVDQFTFKVNDGSIDSEIASVEIVRPFLPFKFEIPAGISLIHLPLTVKFINNQPHEIKTVADFFDILGENNVRFLITYYKETNSWSSFLGPRWRGLRPDQQITPDLGILAVMENSVTLDILGDAMQVEGKEEIHLQRGLNLIGVPIKDSRITKAGDLFSLPEFADNVTSMIVPSGGAFKVLARAGDPGDFELTGAESFIVTAKADSVITLTGQGWSRMASDGPVLVAPSIVTSGSTPVLAVVGKLSAEAEGFRPNLAQIWVRNRNTEYNQSQELADGGYQLTLVDTDSDGVANVGDLLEIGGETNQDRFRIKSRWHQLTEQDIEFGWVQLPDLIAREIPAETKLLPNYPSPFNPETWIPFELAEDEIVVINIYSQQGTLVRQLPLGYTDAGIYRQRDKAAYWDGRSENGEKVASGVYFFGIQAGDYSQVRKTLLLK